ncbi:MAG TPA: hypothetical protein VLW53_09680, partial [Candidatus Eisenbacteria bacterium]|nr:hypothetical protein [Candidatus Eisenbacteria bacterium]
GAYAHYNPGVHDITLRTYQFAGVPDWEPVALAAAVPLFLFLLYAIYAGVRIRHLRRAVRLAERRGADGSRSASTQPAPKRSWTTGE